ncbi:hypothetical protein CJ255_05395 [Candidatus Viridilinea mediisalina]|uniref:Uncharacterized protein n=1 Tax=Candidatus Viridilinea mediisalina TaxID=2024553 RepID=A0A2A6RM48_9CHLR|nr:hypothetical protein CJ255_05395 [Candidatus Viridilinea mediisalina]
MHGASPPRFRREVGDLCPTDDEAVVGQGFAGPFFALAGGVEPVGEVAGDGGGVAWQCRQQRGGPRFAPFVECVNQVLRCVPDGDAPLVRDVPGGREFAAAD